MQHSLTEIENFDEALATLDNMRNEWNRSLSPMGRFIVSLVNSLKIIYGFPLTNATKHHAGALYAISEVCYVKKQLLVEHKHLQRQKRVLQQLETELRTLIESNGARIKEWELQKKKEESTVGSRVVNLFDYYDGTIAYAEKSSDRILTALTKITTSLIDNDESLVYNVLEQNFNIAFFMQDRNKLLEHLRGVKNQRVRIQRVTEQVLNNLELTPKLEYLQSDH